MMFLGLASMEFLGLMMLAGIARLPVSFIPAENTFVLPVGFAFPLAFALGLAVTVVITLVLGLLKFESIDLYEARRALMDESPRVRPVRRAPVARVAIQY